MEIAPIAGIRALGLEGARKFDSGAPRFEIGASARTGDDAYKGSRQGAERGLEGEGNESEDPESALGGESDDGGSQIDVVA
jgi:hypothetical protein